MSPNRQQARAGLSVTTLMIASASSLVAALVVSRLWGGGTLIGAAMTPVIVALVSEGLNRPAKVIGTVRPPRMGFDPIAEGRAGLREGDLEHARTPPVPAAAAAQIRVHRTTGARRGSNGDSDGGGGFSLRLPRPRVLAAIATGLVAFAIAGIFLTSSELVLGKSVTSSSRRTTFVPVHRSPSSTTKDKTDTTKSDTTPTTSTQTTTPTTTTPPAQSTPLPSQTTPTVPPAQQSAPVAPPTTTAPAAPTTPAPAPQSATPAPTPTTP